jgi:isoquinoline 1-oxidoreductase alpha subunit
LTWCQPEFLLQWGLTSPARCNQYARKKMSKFKLTVNNDIHEVDVSPDMPLLWVLRDKLKLTGSKFGCGIAQCGACTVHIDGVAVRSCVLPVSAVSGAVTTIEGLAGSGGDLHPLQAAWIEHDVPQCGYCQAGQIMSAAALLDQNDDPSDEDINTALAGNYCRCGTYVRIRKAVHSAALFYNADHSVEGA